MFASGLFASGLFAQNQARIEQDLVSIAPDILAMAHEQATLRCEQLIRSYDPCISCATHFLRLDIDRVEGHTDGRMEERTRS